VLATPASYEDWQHTLVDTYYALKPSYAPRDLVAVAEAGFRAPYEVRELAAPDLKALRDAASAANSPLGIAAAYRSYAQQSYLYHRRVRSEGQEAAVGKTARPGHSEHQLGTTVDFKTLGAADVDRSWERTPAGEWMAANAWTYGFVQTYPRSATDRTCYWYEPWHYRYFGRDLAKQMHDSGLTVREFLWQERG
jgi:D-alanyl-D-alanine carboxypeptidase